MVVERWRKEGWCRKEVVEMRERRENRDIVWIEVVERGREKKEIAEKKRREKGRKRRKVGIER